MTAIVAPRSRSTTSSGLVEAYSTHSCPPDGLVSSISGPMVSRSRKTILVMGVSGLIRCLASILGQSRAMTVRRGNNRPASREVFSALFTFFCNPSRQMARDLRLPPSVNGRNGFPATGRRRMGRRNARAEKETAGETAFGRIGQLRSSPRAIAFAAAAAIAALLGSVLPAGADPAQTASAGSVTVTVIGCSARCLHSAGGGVLVTVGDDRLVVRPGLLALNGEALPAHGFQAVAVDASGWGLAITADGKPVGGTDELVGLRKAAGQGNSDALNDLALRHVGGIGVARDLEKAAEFYRRAAERGQTLAARNLALLLWNGERQDTAEALRWLRQAAEAGDAPSQTMLAAALSAGIGKELEPGEVRGWYEAAARAGEAVAMNNLANLLKSGPDRDPARAALLHRKAAGKGLMVAVANVGFDLWHGDGVNENRPEALRWFERAAQAGSVPAMTMLAEAHLDEGRAARNPALAVRWLERAATAGNGEAANRLGALHLRGDGVGKDADAAFRWFSLGAERGDAAATRNLAMLYRDGLGVSRDEARARSLFETAATLGSRSAAQDLAALGSPSDGPPFGRIASAAGR
ncbi:SEL1-like repeat protein [Jiella endophytica]|uniref:SEL1-like repeat protein n=1 Tax=Jiella endophytica TaxID=2558362 RepID=UPI001FE1D3E4|nr:hypothetical protein [Jiella endophytica]